MPDKHALLSASSSHRWLVCTPSARLEESFPDQSSIYTEEGTKAHFMCETKLRRFLNNNTEPLGILEEDAEMDSFTDSYVEFVTEELAAAKAITPDARLLIEQQLDLSKYVPEGFGTSDAVIINDDTLEVIDFKYGKGVVVDAANNPQLRLYALGALLALGILYDFSKVKTVIFQPRVYNVSTEELDVVELLDWATDYVKPRAALAFKGEGEFCVGEHCRFCKAGSICRARAKEAFEIVDKSEDDPALLSDDEIPEILGKLSRTKDWIEAIQKYAEGKAINEGKKWEGYKLVESNTKRRITNEIKVIDVLEKNGYTLEDITNTKLKGLTDLEKIVGKKNFNTLVGEFIVKPKGAPTLVSNTDKRPEINPLAEAFKEEI